MDNITHTLVGVLVGESAARIPRTNAASGLSADTRRNLFVTLMALGSNVPDLDFIPSQMSGNKLEYLLHHRGHTHTILGALLIGVLLYAAVAVWCRSRKHNLSCADRIQLALVAGLAPLLHIALDATNSYGIHPFWPFDNRWFYGDAVFIVEPLFWAACAPLMFLVRSPLAKFLIGLTLVLGVLLSFTTGTVPPAMSFGLAAFVVLMLAFGKLARPGIALAGALLAWLGINASFVLASTVAHRKAHAVADREFPQLELLDVVLTPMPVNLFCWQLLLVQTEPSHWHVQRATLSIAPRMLAAAQCPARAATSATTAPFVRAPAASTPAIAWQGVLRLPRETLAEQVELDCNAAAFMRFARVPWLDWQQGRWVLGDARFDFEPELGFAEIALDPGSPCMRFVPPWVPPRADLLRAKRPQATRPATSAMLQPEHAGIHPDSSR